jgi:hypothetical protein
MSKLHNTGNGFLDGMLDFLASSEPNPTCPECGCDDTVFDDNGDYEYFFCTTCDWQSEAGEYGCEIHNDN